MNNVTTRIPYMVLPGNHDITCAEFDLIHLFGNDSYYSCPASQRNFTHYNHMFRMPSNESGTGLSVEGRSMWWSMNVGLVHFIAIDTETDYKGAVYNTLDEVIEKNTTSYLTNSG